MAWSTWVIFGILYFSYTICAGSPAKASPLTPTVSTCPYRTINYITHGLPQQCITSSRNATTIPASYTSSTLTENVAATLTSNQTEQASQTATLFLTSGSDSSSEPNQTGTPTSESIETPSTPSQALQSDSTSLPELTDEDSPLESGNFLSFEEWKRQSLQKAGQSEHVGKDAKPELPEGRKRIPNLQNPLDSLGDDAEIDLDFSGFVPGGPETPIRPQRNKEYKEPEIAEPDVDGPPRVRSGSKDAGTTCKERFNYASFDCAANVLKTNPAAKSPLAVLGENKDSYMLNVCSAENKFLILELCNDISIDTIVLANFEFFSSTFRMFRVSVSDRYPVKIDKWKIIGTYEARNTREVQAFLVENPVIWARYLRIEFLTHYGNEFYCPVSLVRVHGTTMLEEYKQGLEAGAGDDSEDTDAANSDSNEEEDSLVPEAVAEPLLHAALEKSRRADHSTDSLDHSSSEMSDKLSTDLTTSDKASETALLSTYLSGLEAMMSSAIITETCFITDAPSLITMPSTVDTTGIPVAQYTATPVISTTPTTTSSQSATITSSVVETKHTNNDTQLNLNETSKTTMTENAMIQVVSNEINNNMSVAIVANETQGFSNHTSDRTKNATTTSDRIKSTSTVMQAQPAMPTMQESFFKSVQKRLQMLESNSSLSLQYIEDQSRALRDAFKRVEQRQLSKTTSFLDSLNATVLSELREFRQQYDQLWQSTVIELEMQRERYERDNQAINARLGILADEVIFQRRIGILQMILVVVCLILVLFSRGAIHNYLELPLVANVLSRSPSSKWIKLSGTETPSRPPALSRPKSAHELRSETGILKGHRRTPSSDSNTDNISIDEPYSPPTPLSCDGNPMDDEFSPD